MLTFCLQNVFIDTNMKSKTFGDYFPIGKYEYNNSQWLTATLILIFRKPFHHITYNSLNILLSLWAPVKTILSSWMPLSSCTTLGTHPTFKT